MRCSVGRLAQFTCLVVELLTAISACAQGLEGRFYPLKSTYAEGEPVWFVFEVKNVGTNAVYIEDANPYGVYAFSAGYSFDVPGALTVGNWRCGYIVGGAGGGTKSLLPRATYTQRLLLNQWFVIDRPRAYQVSASRELRFSQRIDKFGTLTAPLSRSFKSEFDIAVIGGHEAEVEKAFEPYLRNLTSPDARRRIEAVETITAVAPPFLEKTLIALASSPDQFAASRAIPALGRLNTAQSRRALTQVIEQSNDDSACGLAIDALAGTGDRSYVCLMAKLARDPKSQNDAIPDLGELGGLGVISSLVPLIDYPLRPPNQPAVQSLAIRGLANTKSHEAIPYLIDALRDSLVSSMP